jgi:hypothetical protein
MIELKTFHPAQGARLLTSLLKKLFLISSNFYQLLMFSVLVLFAYTASATNYYVSNSGSDSNPGTSESKPWKTLNKVNSFTPKPGDQVLFQRGGEWAGTLTARASGASGSPIVYGAYGSGEKPKIYGSEKITGWTKHSGNVYKAGYNNKINQLFIDGVRVTAARFPNTGYVQINTVNSSKSFTSNDLNGSINYTGASWIARTSPYSLETIDVSYSSGKTLTLSNTPYPNVNTKTGFILVGKLEFLDSAGEWYYNSATKTVYFWTPNGDSPGNHDVRGSVHRNGFVGKYYDNIAIKDLEFLHSGECGISSGGSYVIIENNTVTLPDGKGIFVSPGLSNSILNNTVTGANHLGIEGYSDKSTYSDNKVDGTALMKAVGFSGVGQWYMGSGIYVEGNDNVIKYNRVTNSGYNGIQFHKRNIVEYNFVQNSLLTKDDGGGIYTAAAGSYPNAPTAGSIIRHNIIDGVFGSLDGCNPYGICQGNGIYLDENSGGVTVEYNTVTNSSLNGIFLHNSFNETVRYNTSFNNGRQYHISNDFGGSKFNNNLFYAKARNIENNSNQYLGSQNNGKVTFANNTYVNHYNKTGVFKVNETKNYDFNGWKLATGQDANSTIDVSPLATGETEQLYYNDSKQAKTINLGGSVYKNIEGKQVSGSITIQPYASIILIKTASGDFTDITPPMVTSFVVPSTTNAAMVSILVFSATDNKTVTGYKVTESAVTPKATDAGWNTTAPSSYLISLAGTKTLYAWAKDAAGNVSKSVSKQVVVTLQTSKPGSDDNSYSNGPDNSSGVVNNSGIAGNTTVSDLVSTQPNRRATPVTFDAAGTINSITIYHNGGSGRLLMGVYDDKAGLPSSKLGSTQPTVINTTAGWQTVPLISPVAVGAGQTVWLSWVFENNPGIRYTVGKPGRAQSSDTWSSGMSASFGASNMANYNYSVYCSYEPAGIAGSSEVYNSISTAPNRRALPVSFDTDGTINSISIYHNGGSGKVLMGVYADQSGLPSSQLGKTLASVINSTEGWQTVSLANPVSVKAGQTVWLSWVFENNPGIRYKIGKPGRAQSSYTWSSGMPASFGSSSVADYNYSVYCSYEPAGIVGSSEVYNSVSTAPNRRAFPVTISEAGTIESISIYHNGGTGNILMGVYADQAGLPSSQLGKTASSVINSTEGWQTVSLIKPVSVKAGQTVWLSWVFENNPGIRYSIGKPGRAQSTGTWSSGLPASFGSSSMADYNYSIYCSIRTGAVDLLKSDIIPDDEQTQFNAITEVPDDMEDDFKIDLYPNPATTSVTVRFSELPDEGATVTIYDMTGREMQTRIVRDIQETFDIQDFRPGMYLVKTEFSNNIQTHKLIKR